jgi:pimeloyl-ACP methyl ester carboxylesterase
VIRKRATDRAHRIGTLFFNFGGPGAAGTAVLPASMPKIPGALRARFDIASWDPRGVGESTQSNALRRPRPRTPSSPG